MTRAPEKPANTTVIVKWIPDPGLREIAITPVVTVRDLPATETI